MERDQQLHKGNCIKHGDKTIQEQIISSPLNLVSVLGIEIRDGVLKHSSTNDKHKLSSFKQLHLCVNIYFLVFYKKDMYVLVHQTVSVEMKNL